MVTADVTSDMHARARALGLTKIVTKPVELYALLRLVNEHCKPGSGSGRVSVDSAPDRKAENRGIDPADT